MNRIEFMRQLAALLQDISVEERVEAMQYYNDYFDDAGTENEEDIIKELGSPAKVAAEVKAGLRSQDEEAFEYRETGYTDTRFERRDAPASRDGSGSAGYNSEDTYGDNARQTPPRTNNTLKIVLIILIVIVGLPILLPLGIVIISVLFALAVAAFAVFAALVACSVALVIAGVSVFCAGIMSLIPEIAIGLALVGAGLIITVIGVIGTVASVRLCVIVFPGIIRGIVWLCRKPFQRKAVA